MAPPRTPPPPPPDDGQLGAAAAALAAGGATVAALGPAAAGLGAEAQAAQLGAQAAARVLRELLSALRKFSLDRQATLVPELVGTLQAHYPERPVDELEALARRELGREREFRKRMTERLKRDVPKALQAETLEARRERLKAILERERRYVRMREEAMHERVVGAAEMEAVKKISPKGAYWWLSPYVKQHTPDCVALGHRFWPWEVIEAVGAPPRHPGCACELLTLDEAVERDYMDYDQVPDAKDALRLAKKLLKDAGEIVEHASVEEFRRHMAELQEGASLDGAMIAFYPAKAVARKLAGLKEADEGPSHIHLTLVFLGPDAEALAPTRDAVRKAVARAAAKARPLKGVVGGIGMFSGDPKADERPLIALADVVGLNEFRALLVKELGPKNLGPDNHGFTPHITLRYVPRSEGAPKVEPPAQLPLDFDEVVLVWGGEREAFKLGEKHELAEAAATIEDELGFVAARHHATGYGQTAWNPRTRQVWWNAGDWTTEAERAAAQLEFGGIAGVKEVLIGTEEPVPAAEDGWELIQKAGLEEAESRFERFLRANPPKCKQGDGPAHEATRAFLWAEGKAYVAACDEHWDAALRKVEVDEGYGPVDAVIELGIEEAARGKAKAAAGRGRRYGERPGERYAKGLEKGGEFRPQRGSSRLAKRVMRKLAPEFPRTPKERKGITRQVRIEGRDVAIPEQRRFERKINGRTYMSPPGSTNVYRDGEPFDGDEVRVRPRGELGLPTPTARNQVIDRAEVERSERTDDHATRILAAMVNKSADFPPVTAGSPGEAADRALRDSGFLETDIHRSGDVLEVRYVAPDGISKLLVEYDAESGKAAHVEWTPGEPARGGRPLTREPRTLEEFANDMDTFARDLARQNGRHAFLGEFKFAGQGDPEFGDHAGEHHWNGDVTLGEDFAPSILRAAAARARGADLTEGQKRMFYASVQSGVHEMIHAAFPTGRDAYADWANVNLNEALTEELSHVLSTDVLRRWGSTDVLQWRADNPTDFKALGTYTPERAALGRLLDRAGVAPELRQDFILRLLNTPHERRFDELGAAIAAREGGGGMADVAARAMRGAQQRGDAGFTPLLIPDLEPTVNGEHSFRLGSVELDRGDRVLVRRRILQNGEMTGREQTGTVKLLRGGDGPDWTAEVEYDDGTVDHGVLPSMMGTVTKTSPNGQPRDIRIWGAEAPHLDLAGERLRPGDTIRYGRGDGKTSEATLVRVLRARDPENGRGEGWALEAITRDDSAKPGTRVILTTGNTAGTFEKTADAPEPRVPDGPPTGPHAARERVGAPTGEERAALAAWFRMPAGTRVVDESRLQPTRLEPPEKVARARAAMEDAHAGRRKRRLPLAVHEARDGRLLVLDGNATLQVAREMGMTRLPVMPDALVGLDRMIEARAETNTRKGRTDEWDDGVMEGLAEARAIVARGEGSQAIFEEALRRGPLHGGGEFNEGLQTGFRSAFVHLRESAQAAALEAARSRNYGGWGLGWKRHREDGDDDPDPVMPKWLAEKQKTWLEGDLLDYVRLAGGKKSKAFPGLAKADRAPAKVSAPKVQKTRPVPFLSDPPAGPPLEPVESPPDFRAIPDVDVGEPLGPTREEAIAAFRGGAPPPKPFLRYPQGRREGPPELVQPKPPTPAISAGVVIVEPDGRVWAIEPSNWFGDYMAVLPKGRVDPGETEQQAALRELYEETGLTARITGLVGDYAGSTGLTRYFLAERTGGAPRGSFETASLMLEEPGNIAFRQRDRDVLTHATGKPVSGKPGVPLDVSRLYGYDGFAADPEGRYWKIGKVSGTEDAVELVQLDALDSREYLDLDGDPATWEGWTIFPKRRTGPPPRRFSKQTPSSKPAGSSGLPWKQASLLGRGTGELGAKVDPSWLMPGEELEVVWGKDDPVFVRRTDEGFEVELDGKWEPVSETKLRKAREWLSDAWLDDPSTGARSPGVASGEQDDAGVVTLTKPAGGSNGAYFAEDADGVKWIVKGYKGNVDRVSTELLANAIYRKMGVPVPEAGTLDFDGTPAIAYPLVAGTPGDGHLPVKGNKELAKGFMVDALVANWDVVGLVYDNLLWPEGTTTVTPDTPATRLDQGGTLQYRAQGAIKPFGPIPAEVWSMASGQGQANGRFALDEADMRKQAAAIEKTLTPQVIDELVNAAPFANKTMQAEVREALKARVAWMGAYSRGLVSQANPELPPEAMAAQLGPAAPELDIPPEHAAAAAAWADGWDEAVNGKLRAGQPLEPDELEVAAALDELIDGLKTPEDAVAWFALPAAEVPEDGWVGKQLSDGGFLGLSLDKTKPAGQLVRVAIPAGSPALLTGGDPDLVLPRGAKIAVVGEKDGILRATFAGVGPKTPLGPSDDGPGPSLGPGQMTWEQVQAAHPVYGEQHFEMAVAELAWGGDPTWDGNPRPLAFSEAEVEPADVVFQRYPMTDKRAKEILAAYEAGEDVPPVLLVERGGETLVADGHHRLSAAEVLGITLPAVVAQSPLEDEYHGAARVGELKAAPKQAAPAPALELPPVPTFLDKEFAAANTAQAEEMLGMAKAGDLAGLKAASSKSPKVMAYQAKLLDALVASGSTVDPAAKALADKVSGATGWKPTPEQLEVFRANSKERPGLKTLTHRTDKEFMGAPGDEFVVDRLLSTSEIDFTAFGKVRYEIELPEGAKTFRPNDFNTAFPHEKEHVLLPGDRIVIDTREVVGDEVLVTGRLVLPETEPPAKLKPSVPAAPDMPGQVSGGGPSSEVADLPPVPEFLDAQFAAQNTAQATEMLALAKAGKVEELEAVSSPSPKVQAYKKALLKALKPEAVISQVAKKTPFKPPASKLTKPVVPVAPADMPAALEKARGLAGKALEAFKPGDASPKNGKVMGQRVEATVAIWEADAGIPDAVLHLDLEEPARKELLGKLVYGPAGDRAFVEYAFTPMADLEILNSVEVRDVPIQGQAVAYLNTRDVKMGSTSAIGDFRHELGHTLRAAFGGEQGHSGKTPLTEFVAKAYKEAVAKAKEAQGPPPSGKLEKEAYWAHNGTIGKRALDNWEETFAEHYRAYHRAIYRQTQPTDAEHDPNALASYRQHFPEWASMWDAWYTAQLAGRGS